MYHSYNDLDVQHKGVNGEHGPVTIADRLAQRLIFKGAT